jgi:hypothetical protein
MEITSLKDHSERPVKNRAALQNAAPRTTVPRSRLNKNERLE